MRLLPSNKTSIWRRQCPLINRTKLACVRFFPDPPGNAFAAKRQIGVWRRGREIPSPGGKVAERQRGRMRNGDSFRFGLHGDKEEKCLLYLFIQLQSRLHILPFLISHPNRFRSATWGDSTHYGMIATGNHWYCDSLRAAPPSGEAIPQKPFPSTTQHSAQKALPG